MNAEMKTCIIKLYISFYFINVNNLPQILSDPYIFLSLLKTINTNIITPYTTMNINVEPTLIKELCVSYPKSPNCSGSVCWRMICFTMSNWYMSFVVSVESRISNVIIGTRNAFIIWMFAGIIIFRSGKWTTMARFWIRLRMLFSAPCSHIDRMKFIVAKVFNDSSTAAPTFCIFLVLLDITSYGLILWLRVKFYNINWSLVTKYIVSYGKFDEMSTAETNFNWNCRVYLVCDMHFHVKLSLFDPGSM